MSAILYLVMGVIFVSSFIGAKIFSWVTSKDRPIAKLSYSLLATNSLLYLAITFGGSTIIRQWQEIDRMRLRIEMLEEENLFKCPAPLFKEKVPLQKLHPDNQLPEIFLKDRPKEIWL